MDNCVSHERFKRRGVGPQDDVAAALDAALGDSFRKLDDAISRSEAALAEAGEALRCANEALARSAVSRTTAP
jgi:hypothetical protein